MTSAKITFGGNMLRRMARAFDRRCMRRGAVRASTFGSVPAVGAALVLLLLAASGTALARKGAHGEMGPAADSDIAAAAARAGEIALPKAVRTGKLPVEEAIARRRSVRDYGDEPVALGELSQLLWAAQGITGERGFKRAAPSAGAKYPLEIFVAAGNVDGLGAGLYRYMPKTHSLITVRTGDARGSLWQAGLYQECIRNAPLDIVITAIYERTMEKYGQRGIRYVHMEVGAVAENIYLEAESLGLSTVLVGAFGDDGVKDALGVHEDPELIEIVPLGIMPVGTRK